MLEVDIAEPLCVKRRPTDEEGDDDGGQQQEHSPLVALLSRALTIIMLNIIQNILKKKKSPESCRRFHLSSGRFPRCLAGLETLLGGSGAS